ncbi:DoxX-like protein [Tenacibaculum sp. 190524A02b]|uniref:DoxX family protein n=1 Tax=Tenacibaculum vairaonense TaxID=3137860 RepID=UPI0032B0F395
MTKKMIITRKVVKIVFTLLVLVGALQYFFNHEMVKGMFTQINYPTYLIYPMGIVKILGLIAIWFRVPQTVKEWAYAGFFFNFLLAISAHIAVNDNEFYPATVALLFLITTYVLDRKVNR